MPLTDKGEKIRSSMEKEYGTEKGKQVFFASKNKGTISGVDSLFAPAAYEEGIKAGVRKKEANNNPHSAGSQEHKDWERGRAASFRKESKTISNRTPGFNSAFDTIKDCMDGIRKLKRDSIDNPKAYE